MGHARALITISDPGRQVALYRKIVESQLSVRQVEDLRVAHKPTLPVSLKKELRTNPFLRADDPELAAALGMEGAEPAEIFATLRRRRDDF